MKKNKNIQYKAAFLMLVFSLNTALGFACSLGFDMGYNSHHHEEEAVNASAEHHGHHEQEAEAIASKHNHQDGEIAHHPDKKKSENKEDDCCSNGVTSFNLLNKTVPQTVAIVHPIFVTAFVVTFFQASIVPPHNIAKNIRSFSRNHHPPIPDICIAVQRFLI